MTLYRNIKEAEHREKLAESKSKHVRTRNIVQVEGPGRYVIPEALYFGVAYENKPDLQYLVEEIEWDDDSYPSVTVGVRRWVRDDEGRYIGAMVWVGVV